MADHSALPLPPPPSPPPPPPRGLQPKRVILRLRVSDFTGRDYGEYTEAMAAYLAFASLDESDVFAHIEPFQAPEVRQTSFHIILDVMGKESGAETADFQRLAHEVYRVRRDDQGIFRVKPFANALEAENYVRKVREFSDRFYPWGK